MVLTPTVAVGQGLREGARAVIDEIESGRGDECRVADRVRELLAEIERARAESYMGSEVDSLRAIAARLDQNCEPTPTVVGTLPGQLGVDEPDAGEPDIVEPDVVEPDVVEPDVVEPDVGEPDGTRVDQVLPRSPAEEVARCERLAANLQWCEVLHECEAILSVDGRYKSLLSRAERQCL